MNPKAVGEISEAVVIAHLVKNGFIVLIPFGDNQRYDLAIDNLDGTFTRVQVKTGRLRNGVIQFKTSSVNGFTGARSSYETQADIFMIYCPENDQVYRVPVSACGTSTFSLRVAPARNVQNCDIHWAADYAA